MLFQKLNWILARCPLISRDRTQEILTKKKTNEPVTTAAVVVKYGIFRSEKRWRRGGGDRPRSDGGARTMVFWWRYRRRCYRGRRDPGRDEVQQKRLGRTVGCASACGPRVMKKERGRGRAEY